MLSQSKLALISGALLFQASWALSEVSSCPLGACVPPSGEALSSGAAVSLCVG